MKPLCRPRSGMWAVTAWIQSRGSKRRTVAPVRGSGGVVISSMPWLVRRMLSAASGGRVTYRASRSSCPASSGERGSPAKTENPGCAVFLTDGQSKFTLADGKTSEATFKAGEAQWADKEKHLPENLAAKTFELILVELK